jgi:hypothetical protein
LVLPIIAMPDKLTELQEQVLTGLMLGDGCLYRRKLTHNPYLMVGRGRHDKAYLLWQAEIFKDFLKRPAYDCEETDKRSGKVYKASRFVTRRASIFARWYKKWYPDGKKKLAKSFKLTPLILAIWFCDDGHIKNTCAKWRFRLQLSTDGFEKKDVERLVTVLSKRYNEKFILTPAKGHYRITTSDAGARAFLREIDPVMPASMSRKIIWRDTGCFFGKDIPKRIDQRNIHGLDKISQNETHCGLSTSSGG